MYDPSKGINETHRLAGAEVRCELPPITRLLGGHPPLRDGHVAVAVDYHPSRCAVADLQYGPQASLRVGYGRNCAIQLCERHTELLIVRVRTVSQIAQRDGLAQLDRGIGIAAPMNSGMDAVTEANVVGEFMKFAVDS